MAGRLRPRPEPHADRDRGRDLRAGPPQPRRRLRRRHRDSSGARTPAAGCPQGGAGSRRQLPGGRAGRMAGGAPRPGRTHPSGGRTAGGPGRRGRAPGGLTDFRPRLYTLYTWRGLAQAGSARLRTAPVPCTARAPARMFAEGLRARPLEKSVKPRWLLSQEMVGGGGTQGQRRNLIKDCLSVPVGAGGCRSIWTGDTGSCQLRRAFTASTPGGRPRACPRCRRCRAATRSPRGRADARASAAPAAVIRAGRG